MSTRAASRLTIAVAALLLTDHVVRGQTTGSIEGRLRDSSGVALAGASVSARSPSLQGNRTVVTDSTGAYRLLAVPPGEYTLRAELAGFRAVEKVATVRLDATARVDLVLELLQSEQVAVSARATPIDPTSTTTGTNYTSSVISRLPVARNYADIVRSNPGVSTDRGDTQGRSLALTIDGATSAENQWLIDGVDTTNAFKGVQGKAINNEFVQEVDVKTGGYEAEYGRALGGVINVITKSGGNVYHGDAFVYYDSTGTAAENEFRNGDSGIDEMRLAAGSRYDFGADLGGFLVKDRLWIFAAINRVDLRGDLSRVAPSTHVSTEDRFPLDSTEDLYSGKVTWNLGASTAAVATVFADPSRTSGAAGADPRQGLGAFFVTPVVSPERSTWFSSREQGGIDFGVRLSRLFGSTAIVTLQGAHHRDRNELTAPGGIRVEDWTCAGGTPDSPCGRPDEPNDVTGGYGEIDGLPDRSQSSRSQYGGDLTLYRGNHEIKAGSDYNRGRTDVVGLFTGGQLVQIFNENGQLYYGHIFDAVSPSDPTPVVHITRRATVEDFGGYLQDSWKAAPGLTINAGLRWDGERGLRGRDRP